MFTRLWQGQGYLILALAVMVVNLSIGLVVETVQDTMVMGDIFNSKAFRNYNQCTPTTLGNIADHVVWFRHFATTSIRFDCWVGISNLYGFSSIGIRIRNMFLLLDYGGKDRRT